MRNLREIAPYATPSHKAKEVGTKARTKFFASRTPGEQDFSNNLDPDNRVESVTLIGKVDQALDDLKRLKIMDQGNAKHYAKINRRMDKLENGRAKDCVHTEIAFDWPSFREFLSGIPLIEEQVELWEEAEYEPKKTVKAYKLFNVKGGKLYPLFVNHDKEVPMGKWLHADMGGADPKKPTHVKSKLGPLAMRPGWHSGDLPVATHIGGKSQPGLNKPDHRPAHQEWAEVEHPADHDWQSVANSRGKGKHAHITDQVPNGGHYRYKTNPNMTGNWIISGQMKVNRILPHHEVEAINKKHGTADLPRLKNEADDIHLVPHQNKAERFEVYKNPSTKDARDLANHIVKTGGHPTYGTVRTLKHGTDLYAWAGRDATHDHVKKSLGLRTRDHGFTDIEGMRQAKYNLRSVHDADYTGFSESINEVSRATLLSYINKTQDKGRYFSDPDRLDTRLKSHVVAQQKVGQSKFKPKVMATREAENPKDFHTSPHKKKRTREIDPNNYDVSTPLSEISDNARRAIERMRNDPRTPEHERAAADRAAKAHPVKSYANHSWNTKKPVNYKPQDGRTYKPWAGGSVKEMKNLRDIVPVVEISNAKLATYRDAADKDWSDQGDKVADANKNIVSIPSGNLSARMNQYQARSTAMRRMSRRDKGMAMADRKAAIDPDKNDYGINNEQVVSGGNQPYDTNKTVKAKAGYKQVIAPLGDTGINEISTKLLQKYIKKSVPNMGNRAFKLGQDSMEKKPIKDSISTRKVRNRAQGIVRASSNLASRDFTYSPNPEKDAGDHEFR